VAQLTGIAWAAASSFFSFIAQPLISAIKPNAQRLAPIVLLIICTPEKLNSCDARSQNHCSNL
jgi:hypothetical protein